MHTEERRPWMRLAIAIGVVYAAVGVIFGEFAGSAASFDATVFWRRAAWVVSGLVWLAHIAYEARRRAHPPRTASWHAAFGTAFGALGLAIAAITHALRTGEGNLPLLLAAIIAFPVIVTIPAFLIGIPVATVLTRTQRPRP